MGPLILFFAVNATTNLMTGTAVFVTATVVALVVSYAIARTIPVMPLIGGAFVIVFGGLAARLAIIGYTAFGARPNVTFFYRVREGSHS